MPHNIFHITMKNIGKEVIHVGGPDISSCSNPVYREHKSEGQPFAVLVEQDAPVNDTQQFWVNFAGNSDGQPDLGDLFVKCQYSQSAQHSMNSSYDLTLSAQLGRTPQGKRVHLTVKMKSQSTFQLNVHQTNVIYLEVDFYSAGLVYL